MQKKFRLTCLLIIFVMAQTAFAGKRQAKQQKETKASAPAEEEDDDDNGWALALQGLELGAVAALEQDASGGFTGGAFPPGHGGRGASEPIGFNFVTHLPEDQWSALLHYLDLPSIINLWQVCKLAKLRIQKHLLTFTHSGLLVPTVQLALLQHITSPLREISLKVETDEDFQRLLYLVNRHQNLRTLNLEINWVFFVRDNKAVLITKLAASLKQMKHLKALEINVGHNAISDEGMQTLATKLALLPEFYRLNLTLKMTRFNQQYIVEMGRIMATLPIKDLNINFAYDSLNSLGYKILIGQASQIKGLNHLHISFGSHELYLEQHVKGLALILGLLANVKHLSLDFNSTNLSNASFETIMKALSKLNNLDSLTLDLGNNLLGRSSVKFLEKALEALSEVSFVGIDLRANHYIQQIYCADSIKWLGELEYKLKSQGRQHEIKY